MSMKLVALPETIRPHQFDLLTPIAHIRSHRGYAVLPGSHKERVYQALQLCGKSGANDYELAKLTGLAFKQITPRFSELRAIGLIRKTEALRNGRTVWMVVSE